MSYIISLQCSVLLAKFESCYLACTTHPNTAADEVNPNGSSPPHSSQESKDRLPGARQHRIPPVGLCQCADDSKQSQIYSGASMDPGSCISHRCSMGLTSGEFGGQFEPPWAFYSHSLSNSWAVFAVSRHPYKWQDSVFPSRTLWRNDQFHFTSLSH